MAATSAQAVDFGHARLASAVGDPLLILVPVEGLSESERGTLTARPAPEADWSRAGLVPPVPLASLAVTADTRGASGHGRVLRVQSSVPFSGDLADLLLDVHTASGEQRYQVSIVAGSRSLASGVVDTGHRAGDAVAGQRWHVHRGDTLFGIARRHAVPGVTIYQLMMALQRANPKAFIHENINLVRAGAVLVVPGMDEMLSISDAEARRQFVAQVAAFERMRGVHPVGAESISEMPASAEAGEVTPPAASAPELQASPEEDRLELSAPGSAPADETQARSHALQDAHTRIAQLEDNIQNLNQALRSQGEAARSAAAHGAEAVAESLQSIVDSLSEPETSSSAPPEGKPSSPGADSDADAGGSDETGRKPRVSSPSAESPTSSAHAVEAPVDTESSGASPAGAVVSDASEASAPQTADSSGATGATAPSAATRPAQAGDGTQPLEQPAPSGMSASVAAREPGVADQSGADAQSAPAGLRQSGEPLATVSASEPASHSVEGVAPPVSGAATPDVSRPLMHAGQTGAASAGESGGSGAATQPAAHAPDGAEAETSREAAGSPAVGSARTGHALSSDDTPARGDPDSSHLGRDAVSSQAPSAAERPSGEGSASLTQPASESKGTVGEPAGGSEPGATASEPAADAANGSKDTVGEPASAASASKRTTSESPRAAPDPERTISAGLASRPDSADSSASGQQKTQAAHAEAVEQAAGEATRGRVAWLQDHLLWIITGLLALIVAIIAWLLRRANVARDEAEQQPRITEAMVRDRLQDIDLELPSKEAQTPPRDEP